MTLAIIAYIVAQLADVVTTERALREGDAIEGNPVIRWLMTRLGRGWVVVKLALAGAIVFWLFLNDGETAIWIVAAITGAVALNNWRLVR
ncbi:DUF5658 family protein [Salipiger sp.]|uniref:DUF5658 family protein n=1 Tax=Salipiger sp. TaxID=2078585 RepID=UPI003A98499C